MKDIKEFLNRVIQGDCLEVMKEIPDNSIDTLITDPPYGLSNHSEKIIRETLSKWLNGEDDYTPKGKGFMGKSWDAFVPPPAVWKECFRIMKPGATILVFAGSKTYDLMTMSLRLAGFEIKDTLMWLHSMGFPKSLNIAKSTAKKQGAKKTGLIKKGAGTRGNTFPLSHEYQDYKLTPEAKPWNGWKSHGLKPAYEPIIMAIKPNQGSYSENALKWGVAGLNIEGGKIGTEKIISRGSEIGKGFFSRGEVNQEHQGRFPANVILDEETAKMLDEQSGINASRFFYCAKASKSERNFGLEGMPLKIGGGLNATVSGDSRTGRKTMQQNNHPTVKPLKLCKYLCILTKTPFGGIVLDPFAGSGSILVSAKMTGRDFIGIEKESEYVKICEARLKAVKVNLDLF